MEPGPEQITAGLRTVYDAFLDNRSGAVADYIPELAHADPEPFAISLTGPRGRTFGIGDDDRLFTLQSVSKPFVYALALADRGLADVLVHVGAEPSGEAFNAISLEPGTGRPDNPMINAGAIATTALVRAGSAAERFERIRAYLSAFAGRSLEIDEAVYRSEATTGDRNRGLAYLMRAAGSLTSAVEQSLDVYFRQCALLVTAKDLSVMAATLACGGVNPVTGKRVAETSVVENVLSVMTTCGMYDASGRWMLEVGLPAKSGVSGGLVAVSPGRFGVAVLSPRLDRSGTSVRGAEALRAVSRALGLHMLHEPLRHIPNLAGAD